MDNLTHSAAGLFLGRAGLGRGVTHATWILVLAANAPDIDTVSLAAGPLAYLTYHRHATHALPLLPLMALLPVLAVKLAARKPIPWRRAYGISLIGVASHLALDYTNIYGIRLFLPFSERWFQMDALSVVDLCIWGGFLLALAGPLLVRLVNSEIGARHAPPVRGFAIFALSFVVLYAAARGVLHARAVAVLDARLYDGAPPGRVAALPGFANPFQWRGLVETREFYGLHEVNLLRDFDPTRGRQFYKPEPDSAIEAAARTSTFKDFLRFSQYPLWRVTAVWEPQPGTRVEAIDLRFGTPASPAFVATAMLDEHGRPVRHWFNFGIAGPR